MKTYEDGLKDACDFILGHYEVGRFNQTGKLDLVNKEEWLSNVTLVPHDKNTLLPKSREYFEARVEMWKKILLDKLGD